MTTETKPTGTQAIERAIHILRLLSTRGKFGWGLTDLSRRAGLDKATVHRIITCLEHQRLVERNAKEHRYFPGPMLVDLGLSVSDMHPLMDNGRAAVQRLAQRTGGVAFMYLRSGDEFVVAARVEQTTNRGMLNEVGFRRPLIMSAGGVSMLMAMPQKERDEVARANMVELAAMGIPKLQRFETLLERSLERGYSANLEYVAPGINSFSQCILDAEGQPIGSLAIAGDPSRFPAAAGPRLIELLCVEAAALRKGAQASISAIDEQPISPAMRKPLAMAA